MCRYILVDSLNVIGKYSSFSRPDTFRSSEKNQALKGQKHADTEKSTGHQNTPT